MSDIKDVNLSISYKDIFEYELNRVNNTHITDRNLPDCCYPKVGRLYLLRFLAEEEDVLEHIICNNEALKDLCIDYSKRCADFEKDKQDECLTQCFARKILYIERVVKFLNKNDYNFKSYYSKSVYAAKDDIVSANESGMLLVACTLNSIYRCLQNMFYQKRI